MASTTDKKWSQIFEDRNLAAIISDCGKVTINAETINEYRECRLMTKFDHSSNLPEVFKHNHVNILPLSRSEFLIGKFNVYHEISPIEQKPVAISMRDDIVTLPSEPEKITSEQTALACAYASGILSEFTQEEECRLMPTLSGRMGSGDFRFSVAGNDGWQRCDINVRQAQMEVDAVYETPTKIYIFEAKNHDCDDFILRQLYYPYRFLSMLENKGKEIIPVFMKYVNGTYYLHQYRFDHLEAIDSISYEKGAAYTFVRQSISTTDIDELLKFPPIAESRAIPFPQANAISRVEDILNKLFTQDAPISCQDIISMNLDFAPRQADYYINAGKYLGLFNKGLDGLVHLTDEGKKICSLAYRDRKLSMARKILSSPVFSACFHKMMENGGYELEDSYIVDSLQQYRDDLNNTTASRRASTVKAWLKWITDLVDE